MSYIFTPPAKSYEVKFNYTELNKFIEAGRSKSYRMIGTTLEVSHWYAGLIQIKLYDTIIAEVLSNGNVFITEQIDDHGSQATTYWVQKVLSDNGIHGYVGRDKGKYWCAGKAFQASV